MEVSSAVDLDSVHCLGGRTLNELGKGKTSQKNEGGRDRVSNGRDMKSLRSRQQALKQAQRRKNCPRC